MSEILHSSGRSLAAPMLYSALPADAQQMMSARASLRRFADGQIIQQRGDEAREFWLIDQGAVAVGQFTPDGAFRAMALLGRGDSYGELSLLTGAPRVVDAISRGPSAVRAIPAAAFEAALTSSPEVMRRVMTALASQLQEQLDLMAGVRRGAAVARVASLLDTLSGQPSVGAEVRVTQHELGELLGLTRATINAALRSLEEQGLVTRGYGAIVIRDPAGLRQAGEVR